MSGKERRVFPSDLGKIIGKENLFFFHPGAKNQSLTISEEHLPAFLRLHQHFAAASGLSCFNKKKNERNIDWWEMRVGVWLHPDILFIPSSKKLSVVLGGGECEL